MSLIVREKANIEKIYRKDSKAGKKTKKGENIIGLCICSLAFQTLIYKVSST